MSITVDEAWQRAVAKGLPDTHETRLAFHAGAMHALSELTDSLALSVEATDAALALNGKLFRFVMAPETWV